MARVSLCCRNTSLTSLLAQVPEGKSCPPGSGVLIVLTAAQTDCAHDCQAGNDG